MARTGSETEQGPGQSLISAAAALALKSGASTVAAEDATDLPAPWFVHDGQGATSGPQHGGIGFFPTILVANRHHVLGAGPEELGPTPSGPSRLDAGTGAIATTGPERRQG